MNEFPPNKPLLIFDGDCGFCRRWIARWKISIGDKVDYASYQESLEKFPHIPKENFEKSVHFIDCDGKIYRGAEAVFRALACAPGMQGMPWLWAYLHIPAFAPISEGIYGFVARHRIFFSRWSAFLWGNDLSPSTYYISRWIFLRLLGLIYFISFASLGIQILGLCGSDGILPAASYLQSIREHLGPERRHLLPTWFWLNSSDAALKYFCWVGAGLSILLFLDFAPSLILFLLWNAYLSLTVVGQEFLSFQWDILLLETGFLAIFLTPQRFLPKMKEESPPSAIIIGLLHWLLFRLMFESGCVKLLSGDSAWRNLTALQYHYETQPLPTVLGWYVHQLPARIQGTSCAAMFCIELITPFLIFFPRRLKLFSFFSLMGLQVLIAATGNYCFFNLLTMALCILLLDDSIFKCVLPQGLCQKILPGPSDNLGSEKARVSDTMKSLLRTMVNVALALFVLFISLSQLSNMLWRNMSFPENVQNVVNWAAPYRAVNAYGLFAVMTTVRNEIVIEGSADGKNWSAYDFKWKPGDLNHSPGLVAPHQPRLDWQMWFAALSDYRYNQWFLSFLVKLLQGNREVQSLLEKNPFPSSPPRFVRSLFYEYHFTDLQTKNKTGQWWRRELKGLYCPVLSITKDGRILAYPSIPSN